MTNIGTLETFLGTLGLVEDNGCITHLLWDAEERGKMTTVLENGIQQLSEYFQGKRDVFDLPLAPAGTAFQKQVYDQMLNIGKGETRTYGDIANALDVPAQPVGQACSSNPIPIIIPCHRVVGMQGLGGFSGDGGTETKIKLLRFEKAYSLLF